MIVLLVLLAVVLPGAVAWFLWFHGGSRQWVHVSQAPAYAFVVLPLFVPFGLCMVARSLKPDSDSVTIISLIVNVTFLVAAISSMLFGVPTWWGPRWYRLTQRDE